MDRRSFFGVVAGAAGALQVRLPSASEPATHDVNVSVTPTPDSPSKISIEQYTSDMFASRLGEVFSFHRSAGANDPPIHLELVEVQPSRHARADSRQPFSLLFALHDGDVPQESTLHLRHDDFERCAWFINRVVAPERQHHTSYYEAVFA